MMTKLRAVKSGTRKAAQLRDEERAVRGYVRAVASRPLFGCYLQARIPQLVWTSWRETQLGRN